jgi:deoxyribonuclease V
MILAVDVHYSGHKATVAGVVFENWPDEAPQKEYVSLMEGVADYEPGKFFKRELPCLLKLIADYALKPDFVIVDGYVFLDGHSKAGLGKHLYDALNGETAVVGVAKKPFKAMNVRYEVYRGTSSKPLYVTAVGIELAQAKERVRMMHGQHRLPTLLKRVDRICRGLRRV